MSYMRDASGRRLDSFPVLGTRDLRRTGAPGVAARPKFAPTTPAVGTPITTSSGSPTTGSVVTNPVKVSCETPGAFTYLGCTPQVVVVGGGAARAYTSVGGYSANSTSSPWACEFLLDSVGGAFEVIYKGDVAGGIGVIVDGQYVSTSRPTFRAATSDGNTYIGPITNLGPGRHHIRLEMERSCTFHGINVGNTDGVRAVLPPALRMIVVGDSFTEPTVVDSGGVWTWGWAQYLGAMLGVDVWSCGAGGTGYLNPGTKVKFRDRLADYVNAAPDIIVWAGGINDYAGYTAAAIGTEAAACFAAVKAALPNCQQIVTSPFYPRGNATFPLTLLPARDAIKAAAVAAGLPYVELLELPPPGTLLPAGTVQAATTVGASTISSSTSFPVGAFVRIGSGATQEVRAVSAVSGTGPYTLTVQQNGANLAAAHAIGEPIVQSGPSYVTGTGRQGATASNGTGDRYTGTDATHPTVEGHLNLALAALPQMRAVISA